ncbi:hypothetical protein DY000_02061884 [Brassica cretica]|uniref:Uncharacterized protein n=1 Tax=Brassica cretica TaxID=69181 RepID=A0ABQ7AQQ5_BRACR|nr:hypothetical protein DY000_02061884 [Brassica cretica]
MEFLGTFGCVWSSKEVIKVIIGRAVHGIDPAGARPRGRSPFTLRSDLLERQGEVAPAPRSTSPQRHPEVARVYVDLRETNKPGATSHSDHLRSLPAPKASDVPRSLRVVYLVALGAGVTSPCRSRRSLRSVNGERPRGLAPVGSLTCTARPMITLITSFELQTHSNVPKNSMCSRLFFPEAELAGLPLEFLQSLDKTQNKEVKLTLESNHVEDILELCKIAKTRKTMDMAYGKRCEDANIPLLRKLVQSCHRLAHLLGYVHFAYYALDHRMSKTSTRLFVTKQRNITHFYEYSPVKSSESSDILFFITWFSSSTHLKVFNQMVFIFYLDM